MSISNLGVLLAFELDDDDLFLAFDEYELDVAEVAEEVIHLLRLDLVDAFDILHEKHSGDTVDL